MSSLIEYLWGNIVWSSTSSVPSLSLVLQFCRKAEISNFDLHFVIQEDIAQFYISMQNVIPVQILKAIDNLEKVAFGLKLSDSDSIF